MAVQRDFDKLWDYNDPAATEKKFRELLPAAEKGKDKEYYLELLTQIARTNGLQKKFNEAHEILDKVMKQLKPEHIVPRIRFMLERGRTYNSSKVPDKARELFMAAYMQADKYKEDNLAIDAVHMLGIVDKGEDSLKWNELAISLAEETNDEKAKGWLGALYNNSAWTYFDMKQYDKALELHKKNIAYHSGRNNKQQISIAKWSAARVIREMGRTEEALKMQIELRKENEELINCEDGYNSQEIGECLLTLGRAAESKEHFKRAYDLLKDEVWVEDSEKERLKKLSE